MTKARCMAFGLTIPLYVVFLAVLVGILGCEPQAQQLKHGNCKIDKVDGKVVLVTITLPNYGVGNGATEMFNDRDKLLEYITVLESLVTDAKEAAEQMKVYEPGDVRPSPPVKPSSSD